MGPGEVEHWSGFAPPTTSWLPPPSTSRTPSPPCAPAMDVALVLRTASHCRSRLGAAAAGHPSPL
eukprot:4293331-Heterocapsa_arctica.AAC.1